MAEMSDLWVSSKRNSMILPESGNEKGVKLKWEAVGCLVFELEDPSCSTANVLSSIPSTEVVEQLTGKNLCVKKWILREEQDLNLTDLVAWTYLFLHSVELESVLPGQR